ncbi:MAG: glycine cleavage system protein H [Myxococcales bacterium]|nr:glycine cleavage system protein H [Myxococcales bacterium]
MSNPSDLLYTEDHEWALVEDDTVTVGITNHAQDSLGDVVFVELPELEQELGNGDALGVVESVKAVSDLYSPCDGVVVEVNERLNDEPELINNDPYGDGWIIKVKIADSDAVSHLMDSETYDQYVKDEG